MAKYLERIGHSVRVVAAGTRRKIYTEGNVHRVWGEFEHHTEKAFSSYIEKLFRLTLLPNDEGISWVPRAVKLVSGWPDIGPHSTLISTFPPLSTHLAALWLKKRCGVRWIADFRDPLTHNAARQSAFIDTLLEPRVIDAADILIANTDVVAETWKHQYPAAASKVHVLWNGFDPETALRARPIPPRPYKVISHVGAIYSGRHPTALLASMERLIGRGIIAPDAIQVHLVGSISETGFLPLLERLAQTGYVKYNSHGVPRAEADRITAESDALLLLDVIDREAGKQVPSKLFDYVRIGRPILASTLRNSPVHRILARSGVPHVMLHPDLEESEIDRRVTEFLRLPSDPCEPTAWFMEQFNAASQALTLSAIIQGEAESLP
jgi:hypothetical protein